MATYITITTTTMHPLFDMNGEQRATRSVDEISSTFQQHFAHVKGDNDPPTGTTRNEQHTTKYGFKLLSTRQAAATTTLR